jgi:phosphoketolase
MRHNLYDKAELLSGRLTESCNSYRPLKLPADWKQFAGQIEEQISPMRATAQYLTAAIELNPKDFRIFSPDGRSK